MLTSAAVALSGCAQIEETAGDIASDAASQVAGAAAEEVRSQVCNVIDDGAVSAADQEFLGGLVDAAETAGVPDEITGPLRDIAAAGDQVPEESVEALNEACAPAS